MSSNKRSGQRWLSSLFTSSSRKRRAQSRRCLNVEPLEVRRVLTAALSVDITDPGCSAAGPVYCEIQQAVSAADPGDRIKVAAGTYKPVVIDKDDLTIVEAKPDSDPIIDGDVNPGDENGVEIRASGVTVKGLTVRNASGTSSTGSKGNGFFVEGDNNRITGNNAEDNDDAGFIITLHSNENVLRDNTASGNGGYGFLLGATRRNTLQQNAAVGNAAGFLLLGGQYHELAKNRASGNTGYGFILATGRASFNGNVSNANGLDGFWLESSYVNTFKDNTAADNGRIGFHIWNAEHNTFIGNSATNNGQHAGFMIISGHSNNFTGNSANGNVGAGFLFSGSPRNSTFTGNIASNNHGDGFHIYSGSGNTFTGNIAEDNDRDGFRIGGTVVFGNTFTGNAAKRNAGYGFYVDLAIDALANEFQGNDCEQNLLGGDNREDLDIC